MNSLLFTRDAWFNQPTLPKLAAYTHYGNELFSSSMDSSINKVITSTSLPNVDRSAFADTCF